MKKKGVIKIKLVLLLFVVGDYVKNDMVLDEEDFLKSVL